MHWKDVATGGGPNSARFRLLRPLAVLLVGLYLAGGLLSGLAFVRKVLIVPAAAPLRPTTVPATTGALPATPTTQATPAPAAATPTPANTDRVTILLLGTDLRPDERARGEPGRTDTLILMTMDPVARTAGMLSIPRDLWVPIPFPGRVAEDRINTAYFWGEAYRYPGGGPALTKKTVEYNFGVAVPYYARIEFPGFVRIVDTLGGIDVDVPRAIRDDQYPTNNYGVMTISFPAGHQHLNGERALQYARTRHADSDFGRMQRQQQVLVALRERALQLNVLPRLPQLVAALKDTVDTDLPVPLFLKLAEAGRHISRDRVVVRSIESPAVNEITTSGGADVLIPNRRELAKVVNDVFGNER